MIRGQFNDELEPIVSLMLRGPTGAETQLDFVVDTAFTGAITLPERVVSQLHLEFFGLSRTVLADGSYSPCDVYTVQVLWFGQYRPVFVSVLPNEQLLGVKLLRNHQLYLDVRTGGAVVIQ